MVTVKDVPTDKLIEKLSKELKKMKEVKPPEWAAFVKTGPHAERPPDNPDWWYVRAASLLRKIQLQGPIGVSKLRNWYGGRKKRGSKPEKHVKAGGKIIRLCLQQLEAAGLVKQMKTKGRVITPKGQAILDKVASDIRKG